MAKPLYKLGEFYVYRFDTTIFYMPYEGFYTSTV